MLVVEESTANRDMSSILRTNSVGAFTEQQAGGGEGG